MNANALITDDMSLDQKLAAIDAAMANAVAVAQDEAQSRGLNFVQPDPADLTMCDGCQ